MKTSSRPFLIFLAASALLIGTFFAYRPWIERAIIEGGEAVYVAVSQWFGERDQQVPTVRSLVSPD